MEQIPIQADMHSMAAVAAAQGQGRGIRSSGDSLHDPFWQIVQSMMEQMLAGDALTAQQPGIGSSEQPSGETDADDPLLLSFAAMLFADPGQLPPAVVEQLGAALQQTPVAAAVPVDAAAADHTAGGRSPVSDVVPQAEPMSADASFQTARQRTESVWTQPRAEQTTRAAGPEDFQRLFSAQQQQRSALDTAKRQFRQQPAPARQDAALDVDRLQNELSLIRPSQFAAAALQPQTEDTAEAPDLLKQLTAGLSSRLAQGESAFSVKLKPDSLGDITVRLIERDGKTTLQLVTASAQTARMINSDLSALREAMRPMQVEVYEAVTQTQQSQQGQLQQFDLSGQAFADQRQAFYRPQQAPLYSAGPDYGQEPAQELQGLTEEGLNLYI